MVFRLGWIIWSVVKSAGVVMHRMEARKPEVSGVLRPVTGEDNNDRTARRIEEVVADAWSVDREVSGPFSAKRSFLCRYRFALSSGSLGRVGLSAGWQSRAGTRAPIALPGSVTTGYTQAGWKTIYELTL